MLGPGQARGLVTCAISEAGASDVAKWSTPSSIASVSITAMAAAAMRLCAEVFRAVCAVVFMVGSGVSS